jgi:hypothetical protein
MVKWKVNGQWKNLPIQMSTNGRITAIPGGTFYLRYDRNQWESVGKEPDAAMAATISPRHGSRFRSQARPS